MEPHDNWHWAEHNDECLSEDEHETLELLRQLEAVLKWLVSQKPPFVRLDISKSVQQRPRRPNRLIMLDGLPRRLHEEISKLEGLLSEKYDPAELGEYGTINQHLGRRSFHHGFIDKRRSVPLLRRSSPDVIRFLVQVPNFREHVTRENHAHFGIHYHYLDSKKRRSDTVLCFAPPSPWPLFAEKHAERSAQFPARPGAWVEDRRKAVYDVLNVEKSRFSSNEFRRPSNGSALVWQENAASLRKTKNSLGIVLTDKTVLRLH